MTDKTAEEADAKAEAKAQAEDKQRGIASSNAPRRHWLRWLYISHDAVPVAFRYALLVFDLLTIVYFVWTSLGDSPIELLWVDLTIGAVIVADLVVRFYIADKRLKFVLSVPTIADIIVIISLIVPLISSSNLGFLRALRLLRVARSFRMVESLRNVRDWLPVNVRVMQAAFNLSVFVFVITSFVYVLEKNTDSGIHSWIDALYFTVTSLTTTGYGDIILQGTYGRVLTIAIMLFGVGLFLKLLKELYQPDKVEQPCDHCGLRLHEYDASHCKHCGHIIRIEEDGTD